MDAKVYAFRLRGGSCPSLPVGSSAAPSAQPLLDIELPPDNGDRRPLCHLCERHPADVAHGEGAWCAACALSLFGAFVYDALLGERA